MRSARLPASRYNRMLGGSKTSVPVYITAVWRGNIDQSHVPIKDQAVYARRLKDAGFNAFKMRIFRPNFMDDVESCAGILAACGTGFKVMVDRTAHLSGSVWDYPTGLAAAKALQESASIGSKSRFRATTLTVPRGWPGKWIFRLPVEKDTAASTPSGNASLRIHTIFFSRTFEPLAAC